ncbi:MAG: VacJ family lipoprotein [Thiohalobacterales bacterium]|nr:VacJ family lipoprotein [Thiohalobacterales bacterium]
MNNKNILVLLLLLALPQHGMCSESPSGDEPATTEIAPAENDLPLFDEADFIEVYDPLEPVNRAIFWFNDKVYFLVLKPVARGWRYTPEPLRISIDNFFTNLKAPVRILNTGLQGKFGAAGRELTRFFTNTTLGIAGLFDPAAEHFELQPQDEDTGQTLGVYGVGSGPYLVLPFLGPSNLRDGIGRIPDAYLNLAWYLWKKDAGSDNYDYLGARAADVINFTSIDKDTYEGIKRDSLDPYLFMRDAYEQYRRNQIAN